MKKILTTMFSVFLIITALNVKVMAEGEPEDVEFTQNTTITGYHNYGNVTVDENVVLTFDTGTDVIVDIFDLTIKDGAKVIINGTTGDNLPSGIHVNEGGSISICDGASLTGNGNHVLDIENEVTLTNLDIYCCGTKITNGVVGHVVCSYFDDGEFAQWNANGIIVNKDENTSVSYYLNSDSSNENPLAGNFIPMSVYEEGKGISSITFKITGENVGGVKVWYNQGDKDYNHYYPLTNSKYTLNLSPIDYSIDVLGEGHALDNEIVIYKNYGTIKNSDNQSIDKITSYVKDQEYNLKLYLPSDEENYPEDTDCIVETNYINEVNHDEPQSQDEQFTIERGDYVAEGGYYPLSITPNVSYAGIELGIYWSDNEKAYYNPTINRETQFEYIVNLIGGTNTYAISGKTPYPFGESKKFIINKTDPNVVTGTYEIPKFYELDNITLHIGDGSYEITQEEGIYGKYSLSENTITLDSYVNENCSVDISIKEVEENKFADFKEDVLNEEWAYYGTADQIKSYLATNIFNYYVFSQNGNEVKKYSELFTDKTQKEQFTTEVQNEIIGNIKGMITLSDLKDNAFNLELTNGYSLKYYDFTFKYSTDNEFTTRVYLLSKDANFIYSYLSENTRKYTECEAERSLLYTSYLTIPSNATDYYIFGNGISEEGQTRMADGQSAKYHVALQLATSRSNVHTTKNEKQEIVGAACSFVVYRDNFLGIHVAAPNYAAAWAFRNFPTYSVNDPAIATVFYNNNSIDITSPENSPCTITNIVFYNGQKTMNGSRIEDDGHTVTFGSIFYDTLKIRIYYDNGSSKIATINRVGLNIGEGVKDNKVQVWHGTDKKSEYATSYSQAIYATYYYKSEGTPKPSKPSDNERVQLFVTLTYADGSKETKIVVPKNNNVIDGTEETGESWQGTDGKYGDDFILWEGDNNMPVKAEAIVYVEGSDANTFGGAKLGSGTGVSWVKKVEE